MTKALVPILAIAAAASATFAIIQMSEVAEGVKTTRAAKILAEKAGIQMPITNEVHAVLYAKKLVRDAVAELMSRPLQTEKNW